MSKTKTETIERRRETGRAPTRSLRPGSLPADLIEFEELGLGDLPAPIMRAVADYALSETEWRPALAAKREEAEAALKGAASRRAALDAETYADILRKGPDAFAQLANLTAGADPVAEAEADYDAAQRAYVASAATAKGLVAHIRGLMVGEYRDTVLAALDKAWQRSVRFTVTSTMTVGELHTLEGIRAETLPLLMRLVAQLEPGSAADVKTLRAAFANPDEWDVCPTPDRIRERQREADVNTPQHRAKVEAEARAAAAREADREAARANAQLRRGLGRPDTTARDSADDLVEAAAG